MKEVVIKVSEDVKDYFFEEGYEYEFKLEEEGDEVYCSKDNEWYTCYRSSGAFVLTRTFVNAIKEWPAEGDKYWFLSSGGTPFEEVWGGCTIDSFRKSTGNCCPTKEEAEAYKKKLLKIGENK
jgi:hypothetical protein